MTGNANGMEFIINESTLCVRKLNGIQCLSEQIPHTSACGPIFVSQFGPKKALLEYSDTVNQIINEVTNN